MPWEYFSNVIIHQHATLNCKNKAIKIAAFDLDGTLIKTKSGAVKSKNKDDWVIINNSIDKLREIKNDHVILIVTNQKWISTGRMDYRDVVHKIDKIFEMVGCDFYCGIACSGDEWRKPNPTIYSHLSEAIEVWGGKVDTKNSFYVGDAAGRSGANGRRRDFSDSDKMFAQNSGITFYTPEEYFVTLKNTVAERKTFEKVAINSMIGKEIVVEKVSELEIVMLVGSPSSGKSTFCKQYFSSYVRVNKDTEGTDSKCYKLTKKSLDEGKSVVIDNTNREEKNRIKYLDIAKEKGIKVRCFWLTADKELALRLNVYRERTTGRRLTSMAHRYYFSHFSEPKLVEGFSKIEKIPFTFNTEIGDEKVFSEV